MSSPRQHDLFGVAILSGVQRRQESREVLELGVGVLHQLQAHHVRDDVGQLLWRKAGFRLNEPWGAWVWRLGPTGAAQRIGRDPAPRRMPCPPPQLSIPMRNQVQACQRSAGDSRRGRVEDNRPPFANGAGDRLGQLDAPKPIAPGRVGLLPGQHPAAEGGPARP